MSCNERGRGLTVRFFRALPSPRARRPSLRDSRWTPGYDLRMHRLPTFVRLLALILTALQLSSRAAATLADARVMSTLVRAAAEGRLVHAEGERGADCVRVHEPDCEFCRHLAVSADTDDAPAPRLRHVVAAPGLAAGTDRRPASIHAGPESARPPPSV